MSPLGARCAGEAGRVERFDLQLRQSAMRTAANVYSLYGIEADAGLGPKRKAVVHTRRKLPRHGARNRRLDGNDGPTEIRRGDDRQPEQRKYQFRSKSEAYEIS